MLELTKFSETDYLHYPYVENLGGTIEPRIAQAKMALPDQEPWLANLVVDGNGIQIMVYDETGEQRMVFCREISPFPLAVFVAENLAAPLEPAVLINFGFERFK